MMSCFAGDYVMDKLSSISPFLYCLGGLLVNPLCGEPVLAALGDSLKLAMATVIWFENNVGFKYYYEVV